MINNWKELPMGKFQAISKISEHNTDDELEQVEDTLKVVSILSDIPVGKLEDLPIGEFVELDRQAAFLSEEMPKSEQDLKGGRIRINGKEYYLFKDFTEMKTGHYIDFQKLLKTINEDMALILSTCIIPVGKEYNRGYDITKVQNEIREHLSIVDANAICFFFADLYKSSIQDSLTCLEQDKSLSEESREKMKEQTTAMRTALHLDGVGKAM